MLPKGHRPGVALQADVAPDDKIGSQGHQTGGQGIAAAGLVHLFEGGPHLVPGAAHPAGVADPPPVLVILDGHRLLHALAHLAGKEPVKEPPLDARVKEPLLDGHAVLLDQARASGRDGSPARLAYTVSSSIAPVREAFTHTLPLLGQFLAPCRRGTFTFVNVPALTSERGCAMLY